MNDYQFKDSHSIITPALIFYYDGIKENISKTVRIAGDSKKLWPHMKTHKCAEIIQMQIAAGITRFKCATIAEAELTAFCGATDVLIAYPLIGPNQKRFLHLQKAFPKTTFWTIGDDLNQLKLLGQTLDDNGMTGNVLIDVNVGLNRTGVSLDKLEGFYKACYTYAGLKVRGFHCYDGQRRESDFDTRYAEVAKYAIKLKQIRQNLIVNHYTFDTLVAGTTPSFPCFVKYGLDDTYFSPGTLILNDSGYSRSFPDLQFKPAASIMTRVISNPLSGQFTLDLGVKGIATDPGTDRGVIVGMPHVKSLFQNEEHWVFQMERGYEDQTPKVGDELFVIPTHICPTCALYSHATVIQNGEIIAEWKIAARDRMLTY